MHDYTISDTVNKLLSSRPQSIRSAGFETVGDDSLPSVSQAREHAPDRVPHRAEPAKVRVREVSAAATAHGLPPSLDPPRHMRI